MPVGRPSPEYMAQVVDGMRATLAARAATAPEPVNLTAARSLFVPIPLVWGDEEYSVRTISYLEGLELEERRRRLREFQRSEEETDEQLARHRAFIAETLRMFWGLLDPQPAINPFLRLAPREVGAVLGFFCTCLRMQIHLSHAAATDLSRMTTSTPSRSS